MRYHRCYILTVRKKPEDLYPANFWAQWASWYYPSNAMVLRLDAMVHDRSHHGQVMFQLQQQLELFPKFHRQFLVDHLGKQVQKHSKKSDRKTPWWNSKWVFVPCFFSTKNDGVFSPKKWPPPPSIFKTRSLSFLHVFPWIQPVVPQRCASLNLIDSCIGVSMALVSMDVNPSERQRSMARCSGWKHENFMVFHGVDRN